MDKIDLFTNATFELLVYTDDYTLLLFLDLVCLLYYIDSIHFYYKKVVCQLWDAFGKSTLLFLSEQKVSVTSSGGIVYKGRIMY